MSWPVDQCEGQGGRDDGHTWSGAERVVTALLGVFDPATAELLLASAGQLPRRWFNPAPPGTRSRARRATPRGWHSSPRCSPGHRWAPGATARSYA
jgi:hypothetical protein